MLSQQAEAVRSINDSAAFGFLQRLRRPAVREPILARVSSGEEAAVEECLTRYGSLVWSLARRLSRNLSEAEEAVQEIFVDIWRNSHRFDANVSSESTFVTMLARRRLVDRHRRRSREAVTSEIPDSLTDGEVTVEQRMEVDDEAARARRHLRQLKPEERQVIELAVDQGLSHAEIAERTGLPLGTVKTHSRRGLQRLRELISRDPGPSAPGLRVVGGLS